MKRQRKGQRRAAPPAPAKTQAIPPALASVMARCPYRTFISRNGAQAPVLGIWAVVEAPALPLPAEALTNAANALARGGAFLLVAVHRADRDAAKAALTLYLAQAEGAA